MRLDVGLSSEQVASLVGLYRSRYVRMEASDEPIPERVAKWIRRVQAAMKAAPRWDG